LQNYFTILIERGNKNSAKIALEKTDNKKGRPIPIEPGGLFVRSLFFIGVL